jgi:hypothetical protein
MHSEALGNIRFRRRGANPLLLPDRTEGFDLPASNHPEDEWNLSLAPHQPQVLIEQMNQGGVV